MLVATSYVSDYVIRSDTPSTLPIQDPLSPEIPEVQVIVPSPPQSSETLADALVSTASEVGDLSTSSLPVSSTDKPQLSTAHNENASQTPSGPVSEGVTPIPSSSSWWGYLGWDSSTTSVSTLAVQQHTNSPQVGESSAATHGDGIAAEIGVIGHPESAESTSAAEPILPLQVASGPLQEPGDASQMVEQNPEPIPAQESKHEEVVPDNAGAHSLTSAETSKSQGSVWYSPWNWYASSPMVPQGVSPDAIPRAENNESQDCEPGPSKTESEMVKEEALARDTPDTTSAPAEDPVLENKQPSQETQSSQDAQPSIPLPLSVSNPIEASISTDHSGWTSFFVSKALRMKGVWDTDANKLQDRSEGPGGMEVMNIDDEENEEHPDSGVETSQDVPASKAIAIISSSKATSPTPSMPSSFSPRTSMSPKEREPKKPGPPAAPLTNSESLKKEVAKRPVSPTPSTSASTTKKSGSGTSTPQPKASSNLVLPTWKDTFLSPPRSNIPPQPTTPTTQRGRLGKTLEVMSHMLFPDAGKGKGKERARSWDRERENREQELLTFGSELPKALDVLGQAFDREKHDEKCRVVVIGVAGWSPGA